MPDTPDHPLRQMLDALSANDHQAVDSITGMFGTTHPSIEQQIWLADHRAKEALHAAMTLAEYIMAKEAETKSDER